MDGFYTEAEANFYLRTHVSERGLLMYRPKSQEYGTNREHPSGPILAQLILQGIDRYDEQVHGGHFPREAIPGRIHEVLDEEDRVLAIRIDNPTLVVEGIKAALDMPGQTMPHDHRMLLWDAQADFSSLLNQLGIEKNIEGRG